MAEVAVFISTALDWQLPEQERGDRRSLRRCQAMHAGTAQNMRRTAILTDGAQIRGMQMLCPVSLGHGDFLFVKG